MTASPSLPRHRYTYLDGVRGWAALMVALAHFVLAFHPALLGGGEKVAHFAASVPISRTMVIALYNPGLGVTIFFVLSGFVLAASVADRPAWFPELVVRRWLRLGLPILGTSLLIWPLARFALFHNAAAAPLALSDWLKGHYGWVAFAYPDLAGLVFQSLFDIFARSVHWYNPALWTMPTEFWGSIGLFAAYTVLRPLFAAGGGTLVGALAVGLLWKTSFAGFAYGLLLFELTRLLPRLPGQRFLSAAQPWAGYGVLATGIVLGGMPYLIDLEARLLYARLFLALAPHVAKPVELMHDLGALLIVAGVLLCRPAQRFLDTRFCQYLGRVSFMLYLVHVPILCSLIAWLLVRLAPVVEYNLLSAGLLVLFLALAFLLAELATRWIDVPSIRISRTAGQQITARLRPLLSRLVGRAAA
jgi:peptidoglycan/LPS O-acetylase OafA/YrhL